MNTLAMDVAEEITIQQITARSESAHHLVASTTDVALPPKEPSTSIITIRSNVPGAGSDFKSHLLKLDFGHFPGFYAA